MQAFTSEVIKRLNESADDRVDGTKIDKVLPLLYGAIGSAAAGMYALDATLDEARLRPLSFDVGAIHTHLAAVEPKSLRLATLEIALAVVDPDDEIGNEVVRLVTIGNLLQAFATRRDIGASPDLNGHRVLLDTSVLIDYVDEGSAAQKALQDLVELSIEMGVEVHVAEHTLDEWERLWDAAEGESATAKFESGIPKNVHRLAGNPFTRFWLRSLEVGPHTSFADFRKRRSGIRQALGGMGVRIRPHGNNSPADRELAEQVRDHLLAQTSSRMGGRGPRTKIGATADGESCAMVARWRSRPGIGPTGAYFVANEYRTGEAYRELSADEVALLLSPATWLMYLASIRADDPKEGSRIAEIVSDSSIRGSFFGMAMGYTLEEAVSLSEKLCAQDQSLSLDDTRAAIQLNLLELIDDADEASAIRRASAVVSRRYTRRQGRLVREEADLEAARTEMNHRASLAEGKADVLEKERDKERAQREQTESSLETERSARSKSDRKFKSLASFVLPLVVYSVFLLGGFLTVWVSVFIAALLIHLAIQLKKYVDEGTSTLLRIYLTAVGELALIVIANVVASMIS